MFLPLNDGFSLLRFRTRGISVLVHGFLLAWLLRAPIPLVLAPSSVAAGQNGTTVTRLYWTAQAPANAKSDRSTTNNRARSSARQKLTWKSRKAESALAEASPPSPHSVAPPAGQSYGSLTEGPTSGDEIRPALPITASDPVVDPSDLSGHGEGSVVVEITIDDKGNIVQKTVLQSLGPAIDGKVLAALQNWHFQPATRNGVPIPSKQDVYYHFKPSA